MARAAGEVSMKASYVDLAATLLLSYEVFKGYVRGFVRTALDIIGGLGSLLLAYLLGPKVSLYLASNEVLNAKVKQFVETILPGRLDLPALSPLFGGQVPSTLRGVAVNTICSVIFNLIGFVGVFVGVRVLTAILSLGLVSLVGASSLGVVDKMLGALLGGVRGLLWVVAAACVLLLLSKLGVVEVPRPVSESVFFQAFQGIASSLLNAIWHAK
ncbi:MAG: CvpA family protein [Bacillota bacterium]